MKFRTILLLILFVLTPVSAGIAQNPISIIDALDIDIWPDYDRPSVLVLLTGRLPKDTLLPASVTLPLPADARLNAVARIDPRDGNMKDDIFSSTDAAGRLTFITPNLRFRVEYYLPYTAAENRRSFDYNWSAAVSVNYFQLRVQRPSLASTLKTEPDTANVVKSSDGYDYHVFPAQAVPSGKSFSLHVDYEMTVAQLSAPSWVTPNSNVQSADPSAASGTGSDKNWALAALMAGGVIIIAALVWQITLRRSTPKTIDKGVRKRSRANFCRDCGEPIDAGDRFCRGCGSKL